MGGFYSLIGMGQNVIFGVMKIVNFCHGEMLMVGMYITYVLSTTFSLDPYLCVPFVAILMDYFFRLCPLNSVYVEDMLKYLKDSSEQTGEEIKTIAIFTDRAAIG